MENATICRVEELGDLEVLSASYERYTFTEHAHAELVIAITESGCASFKYRRRFHLTSRGEVLVHHPGEAHSGGPSGPDGWVYRAIYVSEDLFKRVTGSADIPFFGDDVIEDPALAGLLRRFHRSMNPPFSRLTTESCLIEALCWLHHHHGANRVEPAAEHESVPVRRAREFLHTHLADDISAAALARASGLSPYHLIREFSKKFGLTPHAYQLSIRVQRAKDLLRSGVPLAEVALQAGFYDQPHFTKVFKSQVGVTPGKYILRRFLPEG